MNPVQALAARPFGAFGAAAPGAGKPFYGALDAILVDGAGSFEFQGALQRDHAAQMWIWITRDLAPDILDANRDPDDPETLRAFDAMVPELANRIRGALSGASTSQEAERRLKTQIGGQAVWDHVPVLLNALKHRGLLEKARAFGKATNNIQDEGALGAALQSMPLNDAGATSLLMQAAVGQVNQPARLVTAALRIAGDGNEQSLARAGFAPLVDALLAHAQNQIRPLLQVGAFADMDLICRSIDRFHKLMRSISSYIELQRNSRWSVAVANLTASISERIEPKLREVVPDVNQALRRQRETNDRHDPDQLLAALNGVFLLATVRECRDSLAVNQMFDQVWTQVGQTLELLVTRNLDILRDNPGDRITAARLEAGIKMAELRFNSDYADVLRRARDGILRRPAAQA